MSGKPFVFVIDINNKPLMPCTGKRARLLLIRGRAKVIRLKPFIIQINDRLQIDSILQDIEVKIDPGSKYTGICVSRTINKIVNILNLFEIIHRGKQISLQLSERKLRRNDKRRKLRYRQVRFLNRAIPKGWLPPSLRHRVDTTLSWVKRLQRWTPVSMLAIERVKFDMQKLSNPAILGLEYQQGTLFQYEVKEYLLEKWDHKCAYCNSDDRILEVEHILAKARGGSNRISNLAIACVKCNRAKGSIPIEIFLKDKPALLAKILSQLKKPLKDAAAVNATRNSLFTKLLSLGIPVIMGTGALTKWNRSRLGIPKTHALDAACVGDVLAVNNWYRPHIEIKCVGRGRYSRTILDKYGFPRAYLMKNKIVFGFATGDIVKATVKYFIDGKRYFKNIYSRIVAKLDGRFTISYDNLITTVKWSNCKLVQKADGYSYSSRGYSYIVVQNKILTLGKLS